MAFDWVVDGQFEMFKTVSEDWGTGTATATIQVKVPWEKRHEYVLHLLSGEDGGPVSYPYTLMDRTDAPLKVTNVRIEPMETTYEQYSPSEDWEGIEYGYAIVTITFVATYTEITIDSTLEFVTVYPDSLFWNIPEPDGPLHLTPEEAPGFRLPTYEFTLSNNMMKPYINGKHLLEFDGFCNDRDIEINHHGFHRKFYGQTLLVSAPSIKTLPDFPMEEYCSCSIRLCYNPFTHNAWFHPLNTEKGPEIGNQPSMVNAGLIYKPTSIHNGKPCTAQNAIKPIPMTDIEPLFQMFGVRGTYK